MHRRTLLRLRALTPMLRIHPGVSIRLAHEGTPILEAMHHPFPREHRVIGVAAFYDGLAKAHDADTRGRAVTIGDLPVDAPVSVDVGLRRGVELVEPNILRFGCAHGRHHLLGIAAPVPLVEPSATPLLEELGIDRVCLHAAVELDATTICVHTAPDDDRDDDIAETLTSIAAAVSVHQLELLANAPGHPSLG